MINSEALKAAYDWHDIDVRSSSQISSKTTAVIANLTALPAEDSSKIPIVALRATARAANKVVSIVEISKRQLKLQGVKIFQYSALSSELVQVERRERPLFDELKDVSDGDFEAMGRSTHKQRAVPVVTVYLSTRSVDQLRGEYCEQTS